MAVLNRLIYPRCQSVGPKLEAVNPAKDTALSITAVVVYMVADLQAQSVTQAA